MVTGQQISAIHWLFTGICRVLYLSNPYGEINVVPCCGEFAFAPNNELVPYTNGVHVTAQGGKNGKIDMVVFVTPTGDGKLKLNYLENGSPAKPPVEAGKTARNVITDLIRRRVAPFLSSGLCL